MMRVLFYPAFSDRTQLTDHYYRLQWYLAPFADRLERVTLVHNVEGDPIGPVPDYLDPGLDALSKTFSAVKLVKSGSSGDLLSELKSADLVLQWDTSPCCRPKLHGEEFAEEFARKKVVKIDHERIQYAGSFYLYLADHFRGPTDQALAQSRKAFEKILVGCSGRTGYIFGTGPGLANAMDHDFSDGAAIACNSMVRNRALLEKINPKLFVVGDPIFHAGCSSYAAAFREELVARLDEYDAGLVVPMRDEHIYRAHLPERFQERIAAIPFEKGEAPALDLRENFHVTTTANILTLFLVPLAATLFEEIKIFGCDGRPQNENNYFWKHDRASQFNDEMENIKRAHPAFFSVDYDDYYETHCDTLSRWLDAAERKGKRVLNCSPSHIPALAARNAPGVASPPQERFTAEGSAKGRTQTVEIVSIDPDAVDHFGHFLSYDLRVAEAAHALRHRFSLLANAAFDIDCIPDGLEQFQRAFADHTWSIGKQPFRSSGSARRRFANELDIALTRLESQSTADRIALYMYAGSVEHAELIWNAIENRPAVSANVNLFWAYDRDETDSRYAAQWAAFFSKLPDRDRLTLTAPTAKIRDGVHDAFGVMLPVAPHPSTTFSDAEAAELAARPRHEARERARILFPGGMRREKGFGLTAAAAAKLASDPDVVCIVRTLVVDNTREDALEHLASLNSPNIRLVSELFEGEAFQSFLAEGDVIVCPYLAPDFTRRTSGLVIDAMLLGRPVVALENTWLGDFISDTGIGKAVADNPLDLVAGVKAILADYDAYAERTIGAKQDYVASHNWKRLAETIISPQKDESVRPPVRKNSQSDSSERAQLRDYKELVASLPTKAPIFLPTEKISLPERVAGLKKVRAIYETRLDALYRPQLRALREKYKDRERCFIIGNGPSLNNTDLSQLKNEVTFAVNGFFLKTPDLDWTPTFYVVEDHLVAEDRSVAINALKGPTKLFPAYLGYCLDEDDDTIFFNHRPRISYPDGFDFSKDAADITYAGCTVTFTCLQLAYYFGFKEIYLIGVDASYDLPKDVKSGGEYGVGVLDMQSDDPNHFHPDYFGKGYRWHDPQVGKMLEAYAEAEKATRGEDRKIYNATVGGKLEVFERRAYSDIFPDARARAESAAGAKGNRPGDARPPRILVFDFTPRGNGSATGELKNSLFADWPRKSYLQASYQFRNSILIAGGGMRSMVYSADNGPQGFLDIFNRFDPELILFRPVPEDIGDPLHALAVRMMRTRPEIPVVTWIMDDWPERMKIEDRERFKRHEADLLWLFERSSLRLSICEQMSDVYRGRYGKEFTPFANGVDPRDWKRKQRPAGKPFVLRFAGAIVDNIGARSLQRVAEAVEAAADSGVPMRLEIKTRSVWRNAQARRFKSLKHTHFITRPLSSKKYRDWLAGGDAALIVYNFDKDSVRYIRHSMANKMPECLASGAPLIAVGPSEIATIGYLKRRDCAVVVDEENDAAILRALTGLAENETKQLDLARRAQDIAFTDHNIVELRKKFMAALKEAATTPPPPMKSAQEGLSGKTQEFSRDLHAAVDETAVVARLLKDRTGRSRVMVDIGAHFGTSASYFNKLGWTIHCFEPDPENRKKLLARYKDKASVTIDPRAVSDTPAEAIPFFTSEQSTGISGLHAFHDTHKESGVVDVTTMANVIDENRLASIDFLKIDVEGFDFSVLKGVPWERLKPDVIECEFEDAKTLSLGHAYKDIADYLLEKGYAVYLSEWHPIIRYGVRHDWRRVVPYPGVEMAANAWGNILAFATDPGIDQVRRAFLALAATPESVAGKAAPAAAPAPSRPARKMRGRPAVYVNAVEALFHRAPLVYSLLRYAKRGAAGLWRRRRWTVPAFAALALWIAAGFAPPLAPYAGLIWGAAAFATLLSLIAYLALRLNQFVETLTDENRGLRKEVRTLTKKQTETADITKRLSKASASTDSTILTLRKRITGAVTATQALTKETAELQRSTSRGIEKASTRADQAFRNMQFNNAVWYQQFNRRLGLQQIETLLSVWAKPLGVPLSKQAAGYLANRACHIESLMHGRLATAIEDMLVRTVVACGVNRSELEILEIGTLFGIGAAVIYDAAAPHFDKVHLTLLDPLDGYYESEHRDLLTNLPVNDMLLQQNLGAAGVPESSFTLIKHLSTDAEALEAAKARTYDILIIDGDHTYAGVKADFDLYHSLVREGGYIVFDDYGSEYWPDVQKFVDAEIEGRQDVERVAASFNTCVYRALPRSS